MQYWKVISGVLFAALALGYATNILKTFQGWGIAGSVDGISHHIAHTPYTPRSRPAPIIRLYARMRAHAYTRRRRRSTPAPRSNAATYRVVLTGLLDDRRAPGCGWSSRQARAEHDCRLAQLRCQCCQTPSCLHCALSPSLFGWVKRGSRVLRPSCCC